MDCDSSFELSPLLGSIRQLASRFERNAFLLRLSVDGLEAPPHLGSNQPRRHVLLREAIEFAYVLPGPRLALIGWFLGHMPFSSLGSLVEPSYVGIELVVDADAQGVVGHAGAEGDRRGRGQWGRRNGRDRSKVEIEVLDLAGPVIGDPSFDATAD